MKRNTKIAGNDGAFSNGDGIDICICSRRTRYVAANAAPLTSEQQTAWQKIHNDFTLKAAHCNSNW